LSLTVSGKRCAYVECADEAFLAECRKYYSRLEILPDLLDFDDEVLNAVANGFKHGARVVTAAALIMISVFAAFMLIDEKFIVVMGFALAVAVFFDAFIVRMTIIPATMFLLDDRAWRLPRWLDRMIPHVDIEGESLTRKAPVH